MTEVSRNRVQQKISRERFALTRPNKRQHQLITSELQRELFLWTLKVRTRLALDRVKPKI